MHTLFQKLAVVVLSPLVALMGFAGYNVHPTPTSFGATAAIETPVAGFETSLASPITSSATTLTLVSAATADGTSLSGTYSFVIDPGTSSQEYVRADCVSTACTAVERGISSISGTTTIAALQKAHRRGAAMKVTDAPVLLNITRILNGIGTLPNVLSYTSNFNISTSSRQLIAAYQVAGFANIASTSAQATLLAGTNTWTGANSWTGQTTFTTATRPQLTADTDSSTNAELVTFGQLNRTAIAGASDASLTVKGLVEEATVAEINSGASTGGTSAKLFMTPASFSVSNFASSTAVTSLFPKASVPFSTIGNKALTASTTATIGLVDIPFAITVNKVSIPTTAVTIPGKLIAAIYNVAGVRQLVATSTQFSGADISTVNLGSPVILSPGKYYVAMVTIDSNNLTMITYTSQTTIGPNSMQITGLDKFEGSYTVTAGTLPATITPGNIATSTNATPYLRLDN